MHFGQMDGFTLFAESTFQAFQLTQKHEVSIGLQAGYGDLALGYPTSRLTPLASN